MKRFFPLLFCLTGCASVHLVNAQREPKGGVVRVEWDGIGEERAKKMARALMHSYCKPNGFVVIAINSSPEIASTMATPMRMGATTFVNYQTSYDFVPHVHFTCRPDEQAELDF